METVSFVRNGVRITMPVVKKTAASVQQKRAIKQSALRNERRSRVKIVPVNRRCMHCGEEIWRSDVYYCWECYKYEKYESR